MPSYRQAKDYIMKSRDVIGHDNDFTQQWLDIFSSFELGEESPQSCPRGVGETQKPASL